MVLQLPGLPSGVRLGLELSNYQANANPFEQIKPYWRHGQYRIVGDEPDTATTDVALFQINHSSVLLSLLCFTEEIASGGGGASTLDVGVNSNPDLFIDGMPTNVAGGTAKSLGFGTGAALNAQGAGLFAANDYLQVGINVVLGGGSLVVGARIQVFAQFISKRSFDGS
jgi:hypothetical protein